MKKLQDYEQFLLEQEKSENTITKYLREANNLLTWLGGRKICKGIVVNKLVYL